MRRLARAGCAVVFAGLLLAWLAGIVAFGIGALYDQEARGGVRATPFLILAACLTVAAIFIVAVIFRVIPVLRRASRKSRGWASVALAIILVAPAYAYLTDEAKAPYRQLISSLAPVCDGEGVPTAGVVNASGTAPNHLVVLDTRGREENWTFSAPVAWRPPNVQDAELVACIPAEDSGHVVETCPYVNGPSITRYSATRVVNVYEARTGRSLAAFTVTLEPRACQHSEEKSVTELKAVVTWPIVQQHLASLVSQGVFVDPDASVGASPSTPPDGTQRIEPTRNPRQSGEPLQSQEPSPTEGEGPPTVELRAAIADGQVVARGTGNGLQSLILSVTSKSDAYLTVLIGAGSVMQPRASRTQEMVVLQDTSLLVAPGATESISLAVACVQMHRNQPDSGDRFSVRPALSSRDLRRLLAVNDFASQPFRVQQFAIWTITNNPARTGFVPLGGTYDLFGSGPSKAEIRSIGRLFDEAGIRAGAYRLFK